MSDYIKGESGLRARITSKAAGFGLLVLPVGCGILMFLAVYR